MKDSLPASGILRFFCTNTIVNGFGTLTTQAVFANLKMQSKQMNKNISFQLS